MTKSIIARVLLAEFCLAGITWGLEWERVPNDVVYACAGSKVTLTWRFKVSEDEDVVDVHWIHDGTWSSEMVATMAHGHFLATEGYSARTRHGENGELVLTDVLVTDAGNYTVEVNLDKQGTFRSFRHSVVLQVADGLMVQGGELKAAQDPEARWDESSQQWQIRLTCGVFTFLGPPPVDVTWTIPEGQVKSSSGYEAGHFYLSLITPVRGGNYTCTIPPVRLPDVCHRELGGHSNVRAVSAAVMVDEIQARLSLVEASQKTLRQDSQVMKNTVQEQMRDFQSTQQYLLDNVQALWNLTTNPPSCTQEIHQQLRDDWRATTKGRGSHCDRELKPGWYRFFLNGASAELPTTCVPRYHCTTYRPMWLDLQGRSLPHMGQEIEARTCASWLGNCCYKTTPAIVRNCGDYFVYKLNPVNSCNYAFCAQLPV